KEPALSRSTLDVAKAVLGASVLGAGGAGPTGHTARRTPARGRLARDHRRYRGHRRLRGRIGGQPYRRGGSGEHGRQVHGDGDGRSGREVGAGVAIADEVDPGTPVAHLETGGLEGGSQPGLLL